MTQPLPTNPIPGTRDFFPEEMSVRMQVFEKLYRVIESYGYLRYDGPMLEPIDLYAAKSSEEIVAHQTYVMKDRGDRTLVVRPEMTPTVARMIAAKSGSLSMPARWYSHPNLWRYERKQRGRYREHWQVNVDLFGTESWEAEAEMFEILGDMMFALGAKADDFFIRVSDRALMKAALRAVADVPDDKALDVFGVIDRMAKVPPEETRRALGELGFDPDKVLSVFSVGDPLVEFPKILTAELLASSKAWRVVTQWKEHAAPSLRELRVTFDPTVVRGFTYYTSTVFELYDASPENPRSIAGGGRYDDLVGLFGKPRTPGIGFGMGDVTLIDFLHTHGIAPAPRVAPDATVLALDEGSRAEVKRIAALLREAGLRTTTPLETKKLGKALERASKEGVRFAVIAAPAELSRGAVKLKDLVRSDEREVSIAELAASMRRALDALEVAP